MTAPPDCDPAWRDQPPHPDTPPPPDLLRRQELDDLQDQNARPSRLRDAVDIPTGSYL